MALQNVVDQTQALQVLKSKGIDIRPADLAFLSPYATNKFKRFGEYPTHLKPDAMPTETTLPKQGFRDLAGFYTNLTDGPAITNRPRLQPSRPAI